MIQPSKNMRSIILAPCSELLFRTAVVSCPISNRRTCAGDERFKSLVDDWASDTYEERGPDHPWVTPFALAAANFKVREPLPPVEDDIPF